MHDTVFFGNETRRNIHNNEDLDNNVNEYVSNNALRLVQEGEFSNNNTENVHSEVRIRNISQIFLYNTNDFWRLLIKKLNDSILPLIISIKNQLPYIKFVTRIFIILTLTILPLINELHSVLPLVKVFMRDNDWLLIPMSINKHTINNDLLLRLNSQEYNILLEKKISYQKLNDYNMNSINGNVFYGVLNKKVKNKRVKDIYINNNICINNEIGLFSIINESNFHNLYYKDRITINIPLNWCSKNLNNGNLILNTRSNNFNRRYLISNKENKRIHGLTSLNLHVNTYTYKPTYIFKIISLIFVIFRWCMLVSRMIFQLWNYTRNNNFDNNSSQLHFISEFKSLISFCIFYIWSLSCVYLLFGLTTSKCSSFPKIALHEAVQWLLWICVVITAICFKIVRLPIFENHDNISNSNNNNTISGTNSNLNNDDNSDYNIRKRRILLQHLLSIISCCGFGFSLSGSVLLLSTRITSPWITSCFITIISQCLDILLRSYLGLIIDDRTSYEKKIRYFKYVFPAYLLKDEEKINCNKNGQREWIVKCAYNSQPPPLIFKHTFISIRLTRISTTFFSISDKTHCETNKANDDNVLESKLSKESSSTNLNNQSINCMICYENQSNIVFSPCLHSGICDLCIDELMKWTVCKLRKSPCCHLCRCPIEIAWQLNIDNSNFKENFYSEKCIEVIYPKLQINDDSINKYNL